MTKVLLSKPSHKLDIFVHIHAVYIMKKMFKFKNNCTPFSGSYPEEVVLCVWGPATGRTICQRRIA